MEDGYNEVDKHLHEPPKVWTSSTKITQGSYIVTGILIQKAWDLFNTTCQVTLCIVEIKNLCLSVEDITRQGSMVLGIRYVLNILIYPYFIDSKLEELVHFLQVMYPKLCQHWQVIWMMAAVMLVLSVVLGLYSSYNSCTEQADGPPGRSTCSAAQRDSWWSSGLQQEQPAEQ